MDYAVLISYIDPNNAKNAVTIILDTVEDTIINASSTVTEHPTVGGTPMADHMYKNPIDISLRGVFSLNGKKAIIIDESGKSLARVEQIFENIKDQGIICTISKIKIIDAVQTPEFTVRSNMVLQSISWTERINSLGFTFSFKEALRANIQTYEVDPDDSFAPDISFAEASNFSDTLLDWDAVDKAVLQALLDYNLATDDFLKFLSTLSVNAFVAIGIGTVVALALTNTLIAIGVAASAIPIVGLVVAAASAIVLGIFTIFKAVKKRSYKVKAFVYYKNPSKREKETKRFMTFYEDIHNKIRALDGAINVWSVTENKSQETLLNIDGAYYIFNFEKNNVGSDYAYKLNVSDINDTPLKCTNTNCALNSFTDGTNNNWVIETSKSKVYLIRASGNDLDKLTSYFICASHINPQDFTSALTNIIQEAIKY